MKQTAKRPRTPPKTWRRNMMASVAFLALLDAVILSATPDATRMAFAAIVTVVVGFAVARIWRSNVEQEKRAAAETKAAPGGRR